MLILLTALFHFSTNTAAIGNIGCSVAQLSRRPATAGRVVKNSRFPVANTVPAVAKSRESRATKSAAFRRSDLSSYNTVKIEMELQVFGR